MSDEIKATPKSFVTSELTPIMLQETPNVRIYFKYNILDISFLWFI